MNTEIFKVTISNIKILTVQNRNLSDIIHKIKIDPVWWQFISTLMGFSFERNTGKMFDLKNYIIYKFYIPSIDFCHGFYT